ncbi:hypothetical protein U1Q18_001047 [Sarracenia purpurea var. burkii]
MLGKIRNSFPNLPCSPSKTANAENMAALQTSYNFCVEENKVCNCEVDRSVENFIPKIRLKKRATDSISGTRMPAVGYEDAQLEPAVLPPARW